MFTALTIALIIRTETRPIHNINFVDLSKTFDAVNHEALWVVLQHYGCPEKILKGYKATARWYARQVVCRWRTCRTIKHQHWSETRLRPRSTSFCLVPQSGFKRCLWHLPYVCFHQIQDKSRNIWLATTKGEHQNTRWFCTRSSFLQMAQLWCHIQKLIYNV